MTLLNVGTTVVAQVAASTTVAAALPVGSAAGHLAVFVVGGEETTPVPTWPSGFTDCAPSPAASRSNQSAIAAYKILTSGDISAGTLTVTLTTSKARTGHLAVFSGVLSPAVLDGAAGSNGTAVATINAPSVTTAADGDLLLAIASYQSSTDRAPVTPSGYAICGTPALSTPTGSQTAVYWSTGGTAGATGTTAISWTGNVNVTALRLAFQSDASPGGTSGSISATIPKMTASLSGTSSAPPDITKIGHIGDSLTAQAPGPGTADMDARYIADGYADADVNGITGRFVYNAGDTSGGTPAVLDAWAAASFNPYDIVIALGTNDLMSSVSSNWGNALTNLRNKITATCPGTHRIWWVNVVADPTGGQGMDGIVGSKGNSVADYNAFLVANLNGTTEKILDWNAYAKANLTSGTYWQNDSNHVHMTLAGYTARNVWLAAQFDMLTRGTLAATTPKVTAALPGTIVTAGTMSTATPSVTATISGASTAPTTGSLNATTPAVTASLPGAVITVATLSVTTPKVTAAVNGAGLITGTLSATVPLIAATMPGIVLTVGAVAATVPSVTAAVNGAGTTTGALVATLPKIKTVIPGESAGLVEPPTARILASCIKTPTARGNVTAPTARGVIQ